jgi:hypothetical protein
VSGLLANLVGAATAALNLRSNEPAGRAPAETPREGGFASVLSAALGPRQRAQRAEKNDASDRADLRANKSATDATARAAEELEEARASEAAADEAAADEAAADKAAAAGAARTAPAPRTEAPAAPKGETAAVDEASAKSAAAEGPGPTPRSPTVVVSDLEGLNAEFRARLDRVIARMETEHGHRVEVVETVRDQARQDHLYAQGRSRPGPVVTWTRSSNHTEGRAADLLVDGTYDNPLAMVRLARIAREEGLRTLGARDPGHVELPSGVRVESLTVAASSASSLLDGSAAKGLEVARAAVAQVAAGRTDLAQPAVPQTVAAQAGGMVGPAGVARVARVAQVAQPAQVAQVASVARVATPGPIGGGAGVEAPQVAPPAPAAVPGQLAGSAGGGAASGEHRGEDRSTRSEALAEAFTEGGRTAQPAAHFGMEARGSAAASAEVRGAPGAFGAEAAERIARVLQLQDAAPARPLSQMVLRLDNPMGGEDRIRVDLRGGSVGAALSMGDAATAARIQAEIGQLQKALEGRGLQAEHLSVTSAVAGRDLAEALRTALPSEGGRGSQQDSDTRRESWNGRSGGRSADADPENPRQRPRKDSQQGRNT